MVGYHNHDLGTLDAWGRTVYRDHDPEARAIYLNAREAGFPYPEILTMTRGDGAERLIEFSAYLGDNEESWVMRDVTNSVRADQELRERQRRLDVAVVTAGIGIWEWDSTSGLVTADAATRRFFNLGTDAGVDHWNYYLERVLDDDRPTLESALQTAVEGEAFDIAVRIRGDHGRSRWRRIHGAAIDPANPLVRVVGAVRDIDSYKRLDERLVHAAQMKSLGQLAGGVAHDFNNLLAVIQGQIEFVKRQPDISDQNRARIESVERAVARGAGMVAALMQLGQPTAAASGIIDVHETLNAAADSLQQITGSDITVGLRLAATRPHIRFDEARFNAMVLNLVTNARDAMPLGGHLAIATRNPDTDDPAQASLVLTVEDTGIGMDHDTRDRIFEPFFTTKTAGLGTGLGLASVYDSVLDAGGTIDVESTPGAGSVFTIALPATNPSTTGEPGAQATPGRQDTAQKTVMVVEDDASILEMACDVLREAGYEVTAALGPEKALDLATTHQPDLLLTDIVMPGLPGPLLADQLQQRFPELRVLYMSGYAKERHGAEPIDPAQLIAKPFTHDELVARIQTMLAG
jgi:signal transduction histidine kinase